MTKIIIRKSKNGQFYFFFEAKNGKNMGKETYMRRAGVHTAIRSIATAFKSGNVEVVDESKK